MSLYDDKARRVYGLEIIGLNTRYFYIDSPFTSDSYIDIPYVDIPNILSISELSSSIEVAGGVVSYDPINISLAIDRMRGGAYDPSVVFGRVPKSKSVWSAQLQADISREDATPYIYVDKDPSSISLPHRFYIGAESFYITEIVQMNPTSWRMTCFDRQGLRQAHRILVDRSDTPIVYSEIVGWRGRLADLYVGNLNGKGIVEDKQILFRGIIERAPEINDMTTCSLTLAPLTALFDNKLSSRNEIGRLARGGHYFSNRKYFEYMSSILNQSTVNTDPILSRGIYAVKLTDGDEFLSTSQILSKINFLGRRSDQIGNVDGGIPIPFQVNYNGEKYQFKLGRGTTDNFLFFTSDIVFYESVKLRDELFSQTRDFNAELGITQNTVIFGDDGLGGITIENALINSNRNYFMVYDFGKDIEGGIYKKYDDSKEPYKEGTSVKALYNLTCPTEERIATFDVKGIPDAFYEEGETFILLESSLGLPTSDMGFDYTLRIKKGEDIEYYIKVIFEEATEYGYKVYLNRQDVPTRNLPSLIEYPGDEARYEFSLATMIHKTYTSEVILELLSSGGGGQVNNVFDKHELGCNLTDAYFDRSSIIGLRTASNIEEWSFTFNPKDMTLNDILDPLLKASGVSLVMRRIEGIPKLFLTPIGHEFDDGTAMIISEDDMIIDPPPQWMNYEDIITQLTFTYDHHLSNPQEVIVNNYEAVNRLNGETASMQLDLYGLRSDIVGGVQASLEVYPYLRPTFSRLFRLYGQPYRIFKFSIPTGMGIQLDAGMLVNLSSRFLKGYDDTWGVSNVICVVKSIKTSLIGEGCDLECIYFDFTNPTWNASLKLTAATSGTNYVTVSRTEYTSDDLAYFKVGDVVDIYSQSNFAVGNTGLVIQSIDLNLNRVYFTTNHTINSSSYILVPSVYDDASDSHKNRCYIADLQGKLGSIDDEGYEYE